MTKLKRTITAPPKPPRTNYRTHSSLMPGNYYLIAQITGYNRSHIARVLQGKRRGSIEVTEAICRAAAVSSEEFWGHVNAMKREVGKRTLADKVKEKLAKLAKAKGE